MGRASQLHFKLLQTLGIAPIEDHMRTSEVRMLNMIPSRYNVSALDDVRYIWVRSIWTFDRCFVRGRHENITRAVIGVEITSGLVKSGLVSSRLVVITVTMVPTATMAAMATMVTMGTFVVYTFERIRSHAQCAATTSRKTAHKSHSYHYRIES